MSMLQKYRKDNLKVTQTLYFSINRRDRKLTFLRHGTADGTEKT